MKTMKTILAIVMIAISLTGFSQSIKVDANSSTVKWHGKKVTGEHFGTIQLKAGTLVLENDKIAIGEFTIDMTSIVNTDIEDAGYKAKLEGHLKSDDFFGVEKFPTAKLLVTSSSALVNNSTTVKAVLTIKGITKPVVIDAHKEGNLFKAEITIDRSKFDVKYGSGSFFDNLGDKMIYDEFTLSIVITTAE
jgi:polyisoprenoid-binding protein YceI